MFVLFLPLLPSSLSSLPPSPPSLPLLPLLPLLPPFSLYLPPFSLYLPPSPPSLSSLLSLSSFLSRNVAAKCDDQALQNQVIVSAKQTALATQALIACTKVLAPCIDSPLCQEQLIESCKMVAAAVEKIVLAAQVRTMSPYMEVSKHVCYVWEVSCVPYMEVSKHMPYMAVLARTCHIWKSNTHLPYTVCV